MTKRRYWLNAVNFTSINSYNYNPSQQHFDTNEMRLEGIIQRYKNALEDGILFKSGETNDNLFKGLDVALLPEDLNYKVVCHSGGLDIQVNHGQVESNVEIGHGKNWKCCLGQRFLLGHSDSKIFDQIIASCMRFSIESSPSGIFFIWSNWTIIPRAKWISAAVVARFLPLMQIRAPSTARKNIIMLFTSGLWILSYLMRLYMLVRLAGPATSCIKRSLRHLLGGCPGQSNLEEEELGGENTGMKTLCIENNGIKVL